MKRLRRVPRQARISSGEDFGQNTGSASYERLWSRPEPLCLAVIPGLVAEHVRLYVRSDGEAQQA